MRELILLSLFITYYVLEIWCYHPLFLNRDEINHLRFGRDKNSEPCNDDNLMNFLAEIQVINPESIVKLATLKDIAPSCKRVMQNLGKIKDYLETCKPSNQPNLYFQLIKGVDSLYDKICTDSPFKKKFQEIHKCLHELRNDLEDCGGPADWNENSDNAAVCKAYKDIADCFFIKTAKVCGNSAATTTKQLLQAIIDSILTINCDNVKSSPLVSDAMPDDFINGTSRHCSYLKPSIVVQIMIPTFYLSLILLCNF